MKEISPVPSDAQDDKRVGSDAAAHAQDELLGWVPGKTFYARFFVSNSDGSVDLTGEALHPCDNLPEITAAASYEVTDYGMTGYIYECRAVRKIVRGKTRVIEIKRK